MEIRLHPLGAVEAIALAFPDEEDSPRDSRSLGYVVLYAEIMERLCRESLFTAGKGVVGCKPG